MMMDGGGQVALPVARCLGQVPGLSLHVVSDEAAVPLRFSRHRTSFHVRPLATDEQRLAAAHDVIRRVRPDVLLPVLGDDVRFLSQHAASLPPDVQLAPTPPVDAFDTVVNKWRLAQFLEQHGLPGPATILYTADDAFERRLAALTFPVLIKPVRGSSGNGIRQFDTPDALRDALQQQPDAQGLTIVQELLPGYDIDCSVLCQDGAFLAYTIQRGFMARPGAFAPPAGIEFVHDEQVYDVTRRLMAALGWTGVAHVDLRVDQRDGQVKILEINARYWTSLEGSLKAGVNFPHLHVLAGLGVTFPMPDYRPVRFVAGDVGLIQKVRYPRRTRFSLGETNLRYMLGDPVAEAIRLGLLAKRKFL